eukprot:CAMPEP_0185730326 /NCGR_PEP_ID=MMETSP1171-20130828/9481_1 /TAXON_ID=374046 /ORGANISM="Helicotheca tamensis, Strain CCMP826" /LENGTH=385 /DNA_ID=CAMNT_0028399347 /DNA_START=163 /DNA_END=1320 /DNA_ORIENTATION=+
MMGEIFADTEQKAMAIAPKISATLSFIACTYAMISILKNPAKRQKIYHRLIAAMCLASIPSSIAYFCGTWAIPVGTPSVAGASGNINTCTAQGFTLQLFGSALSLYYAALICYSFLAVFHEFSMEKLGYFKRGIHAGIYAWPLASSSVGVAKQLYNPGASWCAIEPFPRECGSKDDIQCIRGPSNPAWWKWILSTIPLFLTIAISTFTIVLLWVTVKNKGRRSKELLGKQIILDGYRHQKSRTVARQASLYLAAFYASYFFPLVTTMVNTQMGTASFFPLEIISNTILPLHGFIFVIVYIRLQSRSEQGSLAITPLENHTHVSLSSMRSGDNNFEKQKINNPKKKTMFDGMSDDEKWGLFGVYVGDSDDDGDEGDTEQDSCLPDL